MLGAGFYWNGVWIVVPPAVIYLTYRAVVGGFFGLTNWWNERQRPRL